jgi:hypothetical protein
MIAQWRILGHVRHTPVPNTRILDLFPCDHLFAIIIQVD